MDYLALENNHEADFSLLVRGIVAVFQKSPLGPDNAALGLSRLLSVRENVVSSILKLDESELMSFCHRLSSRGGVSISFRLDNADFISGHQEGFSNTDLCNVSRSVMTFLSRVSYILPTLRTKQSMLQSIDIDSSASDYLFDKPMHIKLHDSPLLAKSGYLKLKFDGGVVRSAFMDEVKKKVRDSRKISAIICGAPVEMIQYFWPEENWRSIDSMRKILRVKLTNGRYKLFSDAEEDVLYDVFSTNPDKPLLQKLYILKNRLDTDLSRVWYEFIRLSGEDSMLWSPSEEKNLLPRLVLSEVSGSSSAQTMCKPC